MSLLNPGDQPSAFPWQCEELKIIAKGMTLRDYFAAKAMQPQIAAIVEDRPIDLEKAIEIAARGSYKVADAMLKARGSDGSP